MDNIFELQLKTKTFIFNLNNISFRTNLNFKCLFKKCVDFWLQYNLIMNNQEFMNYE